MLNLVLFESIITFTYAFALVCDHSGHPIGPQICGDPSKVDNLRGAQLTLLLRRAPHAIFYACLWVAAAGSFPLKKDEILGGPSGRTNAPM
jgi:hypothetical protein